MRVGGWVAEGVVLGEKEEEGEEVVEALREGEGLVETLPPPPPPPPPLEPVGGNPVPEGVLVE